MIDPCSANSIEFVAGTSSVNARDVLAQSVPLRGLGADRTSIQDAFAMARRSLAGSERRVSPPKVEAESFATEVTNDRIALTLLDLAAKVEAQERKFRLSLREAATAGDLALVQRILDLWDRGADGE